MLPEEEAISQSEHLTTEKTTVPIKLEASVSGSDRQCVIVYVRGTSALDMKWSQSRLDTVNRGGISFWKKNCFF